MNTLFATMFLLAFPLAFSNSAVPVPTCQVRILQSTKDDLGNQWNPGQLLPVDIERDNEQGGSFCATGGSCLPRKQNGGDAVRLTNCRVGESIGGADHRLVPSPQLAGKSTTAAMLTRDEVSKKLSALGFSNASSGGLADQYVNYPGSQTGRLVARALSGSKSAVATLKRNNP